MSHLVSGIDLIEIARIERAAARHGDRFFSRFFTPQEIAYCEGRPTSLAGRFAVKEAVAKALGTGIGDFNWTDIEVVCDGRGKPELHLHNRAKALAEENGLHQWSISLSHTDTHAIGLAVASSN
ncbi:MAG TPA: holo-ACP synthase [Anaerolineae bacterium]|jgi:holo-[acyl-carrier protein] synthase|nr:holo-ACP synthase [Anaerolineae bacterium]